MMRIQKILCPIDFFPASESALDYAIALAKNYEARLVLLHVVTPVLPASYEVPLNTAEILNSVSDASRSRLDVLAKRAAARKVAAETLIRVGDVDLEIRDVAVERKVDLIVMGTHGRRGFE